MAKSKLKTPEWILEGYDSEADYLKAKGISGEKKKGKVFKIRECPKCGSRDVGVLLVGEEGKSAGEWECRKCGWKGKDVIEKELKESEFIKLMEEKE